MPEIELDLMSSVRSPLRSPSSGGSVPENFVYLRLSVVSCGPMLPSCSGSEPDRLYSYCNVKVVRSWSVPICDGTVPPGRE